MNKTHQEIKCPSCGSNQIKHHTEERQLSFPYVGTMGFSEVTDTCTVCGTEGDFARINDNAVEAIEVEAKRIGIENMLGYLNAQGYSMAYMERALQIPSRTMMRWKSGECSASSLALLRLVRTYPWLLKVSEFNFDPGRNIQILCSEGIKAASVLFNSMSSGTHVEVVLDSPHPEHVRFTTNIWANKALDYTRYQTIKVAGSTP